MQFQREKFSDFLDEALPLFMEHYHEAGNFQKDLKFDLDIETFLKLDDNDRLRVYTARADGILAGYCIHHVYNHLHFRNSLHAIQDAIYLIKEQRGNGKRFIDWIDGQLKSEGVDAVYHYVTLKHDYSRTLISLGYERADSTYIRRLH